MKPQPAAVDPPPSHSSAGNPESQPTDEPVRRYPRRNLPPTDYAALESPNEDDFICKLSWKHLRAIPLLCKFHFVGVPPSDRVFSILHESPLIVILYGSPHPSGIALS